MLTLSGYDNSNGDALHIYVDNTSNVTVEDAESVDVTSYLITNNILAVGHADWVDYHGFVTNVGNTTAIYASETLVLMSEVKNAGETPLLFARIENSSNGVPLKQSDVSSVVYTVYKYSNTSIRSGSSGKVPIDDLRPSGSGSGSGSVSWTNVSVNVEDCFLDVPVDDDRRVDFEYNFKFEPNTLADNPFDSVGRYAIEFTVTPTNGNRIPVVFEFTLS